ncbi:hypothetical protein ACHAXT_006317 [Thalassiosira profunda]
MPTPRLSSFRRSVARLARDRGAEREDDGWVHGGKYVPAQRQPGRPAATPTSANGSAHGPASGGSRGGASSPYSNISLASLDTPHPDESMEAPTTGASHGSSRSTASQNMSTRTPQTDQLQRMLGPTPQATPTNISLLATPESGRVGQLVLSPTTPVGSFLQQSGVPPAASNAIGDAATKVYDTLFALAVVAWNFLAEWWQKVVVNNLPSDLVPDVLETVGEFVADVFHFVCQVAKFLSPFALWVLQTLIALALMVSSGIIWGAIYFAKGSKDEADGSRAGEVQSSALKSLRESMRNTPFFRRSGRKLPFTGFSDGLADETDAGVPPAQQSAAASASTAACQPQSNRSTVSAMRNARQTPHPASISSSRKSTPATARRVLFSETEAGGVSTEQFTYDKHMPASARKEAPRQTEQTEGGGLVQGGLGDNQRMASVSPAAATASSATPENKILRSPKYTESPANSSASSAQKEPPKVPRQPTPHPNKTSGKSEEELREEAERQKQQYTERYGLLPNITPLSQRYAQMKQRQQQQGKKPLAIGNGPSADASSTNGSASNSAGVGGKRNVGANAKRKRRGDLLGAASRLGRNRRARLGAAGSNLPTVLLHRPAATKRRRDDAGLSATDEWVWRAMNKDGKENRSNDLASEASAAKRGKFAAGGEAAVGTPPKTDATPTTLPPAMTPPKTPGPSNFSLGSATPAPKKFSAAEAAASATPKPKLPFAFGDDDAGGKDAGGGAAFSFGAKTNEGGSTAEKKDAPAAGFSFGNTTAAAPSEKKDTAAASGFAFNASTPAAAAPATGDKKEPASGGFAFNASAPATAEKKDDAAITPAFAFGNTASASAASSTTPGFSFGSAGGGATTTPASTAPTPASTAAPASAAGAQFSFGAPPTATATPATAGASPTTAPFAFGTTSQPTPATQHKEAAPAGTFAFGTTAAPAAGAAQPSTFAFGAGAATTPAAAPTFGGLGATPATNSFSIGGAGTTSGGGGASARRRAAKASGRRR